MTDIQIKQQLQSINPIKAFYTTEAFRRKTSVHNTSTHWMMGNACNTHFQTQRCSADKTQPANRKSTPVPA
jgi:hypothetical protein